MFSVAVNNLSEQLSKSTVVDDGVLDFVGQGLKLDSEADAKEIVDAIDNCKALTTLKLGGNTVGVDAAKAISRALAKHPEFERALWADIFTGRLKSEIPDALRYLGSAMMLAEVQLVELDLSDNAFGPNGMEGITELLKSKTCFTLRELRLNNNGLGVFGGKMLAKCLLECHERSVQAGSPLALKVFVSGRGRLENVGSKALAAAFKAMGSLEELQMPQNGILHEGVTALAEALAHNKNMRILNMNDNTFTEAGAKAMAKALPNLQKLEILNFGDCLIRTEGAEAIAEAIQDAHPELKEVILSFNEIKMSGGTAIADAMECKAKLQKLDLNGNQFGEEGVDGIKATMEALNKIDILATLSEDEESEDDEEDEDGSEEEETEEETSVAATPKSAKPTTAADFLQFPSPTKLHQISGNAPEAVLRQLGDDVQDVDKALIAFMRLSSIVTQDDEKTKKCVCGCADAILDSLFKRKEEMAYPTLVNTLLVHLGLLKGEEKRKVPVSINGPLIVLEHAVKQPYFTKAAKNVLETFMSRPHHLLKSSSQSTHLLLQALYRS